MRNRRWDMTDKSQASFKGLLPYIVLDASEPDKCGILSKKEFEIIKDYSKTWHHPELYHWQGRYPHIFHSVDIEATPFYIDGITSIDNSFKLIGSAGICCGPSFGPLICF